MFYYYYGILYLDVDYFFKGWSGSQQVYDETVKVRNLTDDDKETNEFFCN